MIQTKNPNRLVLGACLPWVKKQRIKELGKAAGVHPSLMEGLDIISVLKQYPLTQRLKATSSIEREIKVLISKARFKNPLPDEWVESNQNALVIGGGIAGITAALSIADCGFHVDLVEKEDFFGGNLLWMEKSIDGLDIKDYLSERLKQLESHEQITLHKNTRVEGTARRPGEFASVLIKDEEKETVFHGVTILATGGSQAPIKLNGKDPQQNELTQKEFEIAVQNHTIDPEKLESVVMVQCSGTRDEKANYCSRVCCIRALKIALFLKEKNPDIQVYILYRDMMSYGFFEEYYTKAKNLGVLFFQYDPANKPITQVQDDRCIVKTRDLLL
ncbi:MAG: CoB--CoM heterodisulfide reductase iron-sulfur subunit A family protein, partial [Desulfobacteraceae bacterium]|nr:CoB--CoM heterodisulfide reductase iron-sulfur subunit A family protein [Desulfobacteraceae bacterium]